MRPVRIFSTTLTPENPARRLLRPSGQLSRNLVLARCGLHPQAFSTHVALALHKNLPPHKAA